ncbi:MAG TPA: efflux RND transporter permease subunit [Candidatus Eisenbacteria bacterium]|nr:efflux RND transporter permease subunit [Candidatus Eisenbacteria bacterium]
MKLSEFSIQRPVFATVMSLSIVLFGVIAFTRLPVREYPDIDPPIVSVTTFYRGASPSVVETEITDVLEEQFATIEGIKTIDSSSREQGSVITIEFELSRNVEEAANDVRDRVSRVRGTLPTEADDPIVAKVDVNAQPIFWLALSSDRHNGLELTEVGDLTLKEQIQRFPGVASVFIGGERRYAMRVWLDAQRMANRAVTTQDVERAVKAENAEIPGGRVEGIGREFAVRTRGELTTADEFGAIIIAQRGPDIVRLSDIAEVQVGPEDERSLARWNGQQAVGLGIVKQKTASTLEVAKEIRDAIPELSKLLPQGMKLDVAYDSSTFIQDSIDEVSHTILIAMCLVILVILLFLKSFRATLIPSVAIPVSIVGALAVAYFLGFTINILTLLAMVLAIGLVVDDAIVVLENVYRHMEMGKPRLKAALDGSNEIGFAILATTISLVAVFIPVAFLQGSVGRLFNEFGLTVAVAVAISGFVALSLTPMLTSRMLRPLHGGGKGWATRTFDNFFRWLDRVYDRLLRGVIRRPWAVGGVVLLFIGVSAVCFMFMRKELAPTEDRGVAFGIVIAPEGSTLAYTDKYMRQVEAILLPMPERAGLFTATGLGFGGPGRVTNGFLFFRLKRLDERPKAWIPTPLPMLPMVHVPIYRARSAQEVVQQLFPQLISIPGVLAFVINPPSLGGQFSSTPVEYVLQADDYGTLGQAVGAMMAEGQKLGYLVNMDTDLRLNTPQLDIGIDRDRAAQLGVSVTDIGSTLETLLGGKAISDFKRGTKQYDVIAQLKPTARATPEAIEGIYLRGANGLVQLASVISVKETVAPKELNHYNRQRSATLTANLAPGVSLGQALDDLDRIAATALPSGVKHELAGQSKEFRESSNSLYLLFGLAVVFIYLVLAAQFESFIHPLTILFSVPLAVVGALISLFIFGQSMNIFSQIGLIMLIGLVTKNAILIVEYANQLRGRGQELTEAVIHAAEIRLRPILMTSLATIFGVLPLAIGIGAGAESRRPLGIAVVGGMLFSTFLTLLIVPLVYRLLGRYTHLKTAEGVEGSAETSVSHEAPAPAHAPAAASLLEPTRTAR